MAGRKGACLICLQEQVGVVTDLTDSPELGRKSVLWAGVSLLLGWGNLGQKGLPPIASEVRHLFSAQPQDGNCGTSHYLELCSAQDLVVELDRKAYADKEKAAHFHDVVTRVGGAN